VPLLLDLATAAQWPKTAKVLDAKTCQKLRPTTTRVGVFVVNGSSKYKVIGGKLKAIRTAAEYTAMLGNQTPAALVSTELIASMPKLNPTSYAVVANDTLYKVAVKFKTTRAILRTLNNLTTDVLQRGQVLILP
jgi:LysM repeat protein